ncbi:unnamed protein product, partial [Meganyctiphanes norvegica]
MDHSCLKYLISICQGSSTNIHDIEKIFLGVVSHINASEYLYYHNLCLFAPGLSLYFLTMLGFCCKTLASNPLLPRSTVPCILEGFKTLPYSSFIFQYFELKFGQYRNFPVLDEDQVKTNVPRKYACNFQATVHKGSSRVLLLKMLKNSTYASEHCFINGREKWSPTETPETINDYIWTLIQSELTLCPVGMNAESYRVYEALSCGSTPVIEDVRPGGRCDANVWRLLKKMDPPVVWIKSWKQLPQILARETKYSEQYLVKRRERVFQWYEWFKIKMRDRFVSIITSSLLNPD